MAAYFGIPSWNWDGPIHRWFAWHPVWTKDRGWRWLVMTYRWQWCRDHCGPPTTGFSHTIARPTEKPKG